MKRVNLFQTNGIFHKSYIYIIRTGWSIVYIEGSQVIFKKNLLYFFLLIPILFKQTVQARMKCSIMLHFIWVFTVCQTTCLEISSLCSVK